MYKLDLDKAEEPEIKFPTSVGPFPAREFQKNIGFSDYAKAFAWITTNCGKFLKKWEYQTTFLAS